MERPAVVSWVLLLTVACSGAAPGRDAAPAAPPPDASGAPPADSASGPTSPPAPAADAGVMMPATMPPPAGPPPAGWWDARWTRRTKITVTDPELKETLTDFQVPVKLEPAAFDARAAAAHGEDLRFVDA